MVEYVVGGGMCGWWCYMWLNPWLLVLCMAAYVFGDIICSSLCS